MHVVRSQASMAALMAFMALGSDAEIMDSVETLRTEKRKNKHRLQIKWDKTTQRLLTTSEATREAAEIQS